MTGNKFTGDAGEKDVVDKVKCPNCISRLVLLPPNFPLFDVQCTRCLFRAQVKTISGKPRASILGAGYDIYEKVLKAGHLSPPLIVNFIWEDNKRKHQEIRFYPFIAKGNIQKYTLSASAKRANYRMFRYIKLDSAPHQRLFLLDNIKEAKQTLI
jgi:hypothetical protein